MMSKYWIKQLSFIAGTMLWVSCNKGPATTATSAQAEADNKPKTEAELLMDYLVEAGDYVNTRQFPTMIKASTVFESLKGNTLVIDLRDASTYARGHIKGAVNVQFSSLPGYFQNTIKPFQYEKIIMVCDRGQVSGYATSLLRLMGYGNVYSMRWGMSVWNPAIANGDKGWAKVTSSKYASQLDTTTYIRPAASQYPELRTGKTTGEEIFRERVKNVFEQGLKDVFLTEDSVFAKKANLYVINYDRKDKYDAGHIPGAIRYKPNGTLGIPSEMLTIPTDKKVVVYCETGQNSAFVIAYLRLLGYNASSLRCGNNTFMYDKMKSEKALAWTFFSIDQINNYPIVK
jgi:rhodanese-related sulfurtransferase